MVLSLRRISFSSENRWFSPEKIQWRRDDSVPPLDMAGLRCRGDVHYEPDAVAGLASDLAWLCVADVQIQWRTLERELLGAVGARRDAQARGEGGVLYGRHRIHQHRWPGACAAVVASAR